MEKITNKALYIILVSLGTAILFNFLFFSKALGISVFIFAVVFLGSIFAPGAGQKDSFKKTWWIILLILFFSLMPTLKVSGFLTFLNICAVLGLAMILAYQITGVPPLLMRFKDYFMLVTFVPLQMLGKAIFSISMVNQIHSQEKNRDVWLRIFKGLIMAIPILILFGLLFSQADLAFSQFLKGFINISVTQQTIQHIIVILFTFVASLSFISYVFFYKRKEQLPNNDPLNEEKPIIPVKGKGIEVLVFLTLISVLFLLFIGFQMTYLFGGEANIIKAGFTYAEYARRGFFELLAVGIISLLILVMSEFYAGEESKKDKKFLVPALFLIAEVIVVIVSAFKRLSLYVQAYGLTMLRFYVAAFIILLLILFILLAIKFIKFKQEQFFTFGILVSVICFLVLVNVINPEVFTYKYNLKKFGQTQKFDIYYFKDLSPDVEALKIKTYSTLSGEEKEVFKTSILNDKYNLENQKNWESFSFSRNKALKLLQGFKP